ncbi:MAG: Rrf2 family transcriptional regulator [Verrucomicrobiae bacterium]|nr:Rrf2 family transcriptional regulator [Verrucomicrobiae bacterium]
MKVSVKCDYACRAIEEMAKQHRSGRPVQINAIARRQGIPANYLVQILNELKTKGLIRSRRGMAGGYILAKAPSEISFGEIVRAIEGDVLHLDHLHDSKCPREIRDVWKKIKLAAEKVADETTFDKIVAASVGADEMYYI